MKRTRRAGLGLTLILAFVVIAGCGGSEEDLAPVEGTVTLNGKPLPNARVEFDPEHGSTSEGETRGDGHYELMFAPDQPGAIVGTHKVRIYTRRMYTDPDGKEHEEPEILPPEYNFKTKLVKEVTPGENNINLPLEVPGLKGPQE